MMEVSDDQPVSDYNIMLSSFLFNIQSLRIYTESVGPVLLKKVRNKKKYNEVKKINDIIDFLIYGKIAFDELDEETQNRITEIGNKLEQKKNIKVLSSGKVQAIGRDAIKLIEELKDLEISEHQINIMYQGSLINLIVYFEVLIGALIKHRLLKYPMANEDIEKKTLKLSEIRKLGSLENAEKYLIETQVELILRKSYSDWISYIKESQNVKLDFLKEFDLEVVEIFQRRNLFVHNEGVVNTTYLTNVDSSLTKNILLNSQLKIDKEYLEKSISLIEQVGILMCLEVWSGMEKKSEERIDFVISKGYNFMLTEQWSLVKNMFKKNMSEREIRNDGKTVFQLNYWLSMKELGKYSEIKEEISKADFSDKSLRYQICLHALRDEKDTFFSLLPKAISKNEIRHHELLEFPILKSMRSDDRFAIELEKLEEDIQNNESNENKVLIADAVDF